MKKELIDDFDKEHCTYTKKVLCSNPECLNLVTVNNDLCDCCSREMTKETIEDENE